MSELSQLSYSSYLTHYCKYQKSGQSVADYCRSNKLDYIDFVRFVNQWEAKRGEKVIQMCMDRTEVNGSRLLSDQPKQLPSKAQKLFAELVVEPDKAKLRSISKFPEDPDIHVDIEHPKPDSIISHATITFPSGVSIEYAQATMKSLILNVVLYEEADSWAKL